MYQALYRAERPEVFSEILGQEHIVKILKHQIASDTVNHAYLFCGTRGTGKTTTARILAKAVNCELPEVGERPCGKCASCMSIKEGSFMDVIEIDAASNNGVDNIRELRESVKYPPAVGRKKVYIIDEVHMLSSGAFNALLKTLEEPPENVIFILCTTEPQKLPQTILSRCMRLDFKRIPQNVLKDGMKRICEDKGVSISDSALGLVANAADGSVRDGLSILDQVLASGDKVIDRDDVLEYIGSAGEEFLIELTDFVSLKKVPDALLLVDRVLNEGKDVKQLMRDWTAHYRNLLITKFIRNPEDMLNMSTENVAKIAEQSRQISLEEINDAIIRLSKTINDSRYSTQPRILLELAIVSIATGLRESAPRQVQHASYSQSAEMPERRKAETAKPAAKSERPEERTEANHSISQLPESGSQELESIWHSVFEEGEDETGSFNLLRTGTSLSHISEKNFLVIANSAFTKKYAVQRQKRIEEIMSQKAGRPLKMIVELQGEAGVKKVEEDHSSLEEEARKQAEALGFSIKIE